MKWLTIIGMGEDGYDGLAPRAREALAQTEVIIGSARLLGYLPDLTAALVEWPQPFSAAVETILPYRGKPTAVLATGDPTNYGVARKLLEIIPAAEVDIIPNVSAFSLAAARMGWSLPDCDTLSLHGRATANLEAYIQPGARLLVLTADATTIPDVAARLAARGFGRSRITVLENLGGGLERISGFTADDRPSTEFFSLNTLAIECVPGPDAIVRSRLAGLPDDAFIHDGQLTKCQVRAATLAALAPAPAQLLWDVGAGSGAVAIEWMRSTRGCEAIAFECDAARLEMIAANAQRLGAPRLKIIAGTAPQSLAGQAKPDAVFIGGGLGDDGVFETAWSALKPGGRMVANVVTLEGELHVIDLHEKHGGDLVRMEVSHLTRIGQLRALRPRMAVLQWRASKPW